MFKGFWWGNLRERDHLEDPGIKGRVILRYVYLQEVGCGAWTGSSWFKAGTGGGYL